MRLRQKSNHFATGWLVLVLATLMVVVYPYVRSKFDLLQKYTKAYDIPFLPEPKQDSSSIIEPKIDSSLLQDTMLSYGIDSLTVDSSIVSESLDSNEIFTSSGLELFLQQLKQLESNTREKLTILWFGDSMIEGDLITQEVRDSLQRKFGGLGVGYVPITSIVNKYRYTIRHEFSDNWLSYNVVKGGQPLYHLNWNGEYFTAQLDSTDSIHQFDTLTVNYSRTTAFPGTRYLPNPTLLYGKRKKDTNWVDSSNIVYFNDQSYFLEGTNPVNQLELYSGNLSKLSLKFLLKPDQPLYGMNFHSGSGIELSNISSRGNSGMTLAGIKTAIFRGMLVNSSPSLIILQFGVNTITTGVTEYDWYERAMKRVVTYLQKVYPTASIAIISLADRATKINGSMQTDSSVFAMNKVLAKVAKESDAAYFDLFQRMGGENSMKKWVEAKPPLANKDYTHFNSRGSKKVAGYFVEFLLKHNENLNKEKLKDE